MSGIRVFVAVDVCDVRVVWCKELFTAGPLDTILTTGGTAQCGADALLQAVEQVPRRIEAVFARDGERCVVELKRTLSASTHREHRINHIAVKGYRATGWIRK